MRWGRNYEGSGEKLPSGGKLDRPIPQVTGRGEKGKRNDTKREIREEEKPLEVAIDISGRFTRKIC